jgi:hypothetical protein
MIMWLVDYVIVGLVVFSLGVSAGGRPIKTNWYWLFVGVVLFWPAPVAAFLVALYELARLLLRRRRRA